jgi:hypothetical protein
MIIIYERNPVIYREIYGEKEVEEGLFLSRPARDIAFSLSLFS